MVKSTGDNFQYTSAVRSPVTTSMSTARRTYRFMFVGIPGTFALSNASSGRRCCSKSPGCGRMSSMNSRHVSKPFSIGPRCCVGISLRWPSSL